MRLRWLLCVALCLSQSPRVLSHDFWLQPAQYHWLPQSPTTFTLEVGHGPMRQRSPIPPARITRFFAVTPTGASLDMHERLRLRDEENDGQLELDRPGTYVLVLETDDRAQSYLPAIRFNDYLRAEGLTPALSERQRTHSMDADGSESYGRRTKAIVHVEGTGADSQAQVTRPVGLTLEIVPERSPYEVPRPSILPIRVIYQGRPLGGALVKLTDLAHDAEPVATHLTDPAGHAEFTMPAKGEWLLNVIWTKPLPATSETAFQTIFSSLSFGVHPTELQFNELERDYVAYVLRQFPQVATQLGVPFGTSLPNGLDGRLRDYAPAAIAEERRALMTYQARFSGVAPDALTSAQRVDRKVALSQIAAIVREDETPRFVDRALQVYAEEPVHAIQAQLQRMTRLADGQIGTPQEWDQVQTRMRAIPPYLETIQKRVSAAVTAKEVPDWRLMIDGLKRLRAAEQFFQRTLGTGVARSVLEAATDDARAYRQLRAYLSATFFADPTGTTAAAVKPAYRGEHYAIGAENFVWLVKNNFADSRSIEQLLADFRVAIDQQREALVAAIRESASMHESTSMREPMPGPDPVTPRILSSDRPSVELYQQTASRFINYAHAVRLFDVSPTIGLDVQLGEASYAAAAANPQISADRSTLAIVRQGFPGQAWHFQLLQHYGDLLSPVRWLSGGGLDDSLPLGAIGMIGWNAYAEEALAAQRADAEGQHQTGQYSHGTRGAYTDSEYVEVRRDALRRAALAYVDVALHSERVSFNDAVNLLSETMDSMAGSCDGTEKRRTVARKSSCQAAQEAVIEIARTPTRALAASLGSSEILDLRRQVERALGNDFSLQVFHLAFLLQGPVAPGFIHDELLQRSSYYH